jgi:hypothetical protein
LWLLGGVLFTLGWSRPAEAGACGGASAAPPRVTAPLTDADKQGARKASEHLHRSFLVPVQGTAREQLPSGRTALVIVEPPPHATLDAIQRRLGASFVETVTRRVGFDGWSRDVVAIVDSQDRAVLDASLVKLDAYLYGTSYRARLLSTADNTGQKVEGLDLSISPSELERWVLGVDARFESVDGAVSLGGSDYANKRVQGVFRSVEPGLVVWSVPPRSDLCEYQPELREFTLESDLVLGALATPHNVLFVGRERRVSPETMPPLRSESLLALAATETGSLAQSYQRLALFSGKLRSGKDWAPILLSDELQGTELGSLLNLTDQMLKSWSLNGTVRYEGFESYPNPDHWAAPQSVMERLNTETLTFNWNTSGATAFTQTDQVASLAVLRTGALPVTFLPEDTPGANVAAIEAEYHDYFAGLGNPALARVVAYTAMYEAFRGFELKAACYRHGSGERAGEALLEERAREFVRAVRQRDKKLRERTQQQLGPEGLKWLDDAKRRFDAVEKASGAEGLAELVTYLASVRGPRAVDKPKPELVQQAHQMATDETFYRLTRVLLERDAVLSEFVAKAKPSFGQWLRTPTVVLSTADSKVGYVEGGHNIDVRPFEITTDAEVGQKRPRLELTPRGTRLRVHPDDADQVSRLMPLLKEVQDGRVDHPAAEQQIAALLQNGPTLPPRPAALLLSPPGRLPYWTGRRTAGWWQPRGPPAGAPPAPNVVRIERSSDGFALWLPSERAPKQADSPLSLAEALNSFVGSTPQRDVVLELSGMRDDQADALRQTLRLHLHRLLTTRKEAPPALALRVGEAASPTGPLDPTRTVVTISDLQEIRRESGVIYECTLDVRDRSRWVRAVLATKTKLTKAVLERIRRVAANTIQRKPRSTLDAADAIRAELRTYDKTIHVMIQDGDACTHVIANR